MTAYNYFFGRVVPVSISDRCPFSKLHPPHKTCSFRLIGQEPHIDVRLRLRHYRMPEHRAPNMADEVLRRDTQSSAVKLAATRLASGELLVVATNTEPKTALAHYKRRWEIETLFAAVKSRGFNLEDTHLVHPERIAKLLTVLALALAFAHATGQWRAKHRQIVIRTHTRRAQSIFRYGYDLLRKILFLDTPRAIQLWRCFIAGKTPEFSPHYSTVIFQVPSWEKPPIRGP